MSMRLGRNPLRTCPQVRENAEEVRGNVAAIYGGKTVGVKKNRRSLRFSIKMGCKNKCWSRVGRGSPHYIMWSFLNGLLSRCSREQFMERDVQSTIILDHLPPRLLLSSTHQPPQHSFYIQHAFLAAQNFHSKETAQETPSPKWHVVKCESWLMA